MKRIILSFLMAVAMTATAFGEPTTIPMQTHQTGASRDLTEVDRHPLLLPISVYFDSDSNIIEVWSQDDNIQAEVFVFDENGNVEAYSPYMNVAIQLTSSGNHSLVLKGDGWEAEGKF